MQKNAVKFLLILGAGLIVSILWPRFAFAHAGLVRADPPDLCNTVASTQVSAPAANCANGVLLNSPPAAIHLWFSESVQTVRHGLTVIAPSGQHVELGTIQNDGQELSIAVSSSEAGTYQVIWQVISDDTHPVVGHYAFSVGHTSVLAQAADFSSQLGAVSLPGLMLQVISHWVHFLGYALAFGPFVFNAIVLQPTLRESAKVAIIQPKLWRLVSWGSWLLVLAEPLALLGQTASLGSSQLFDLDAAGDMLSSSFGRVLAQRWGVAILLWVLLGAVRQGASQANWAALALGLALAVIDGQASHAVSSGPLIVGLPANTVHLVAMGAWVGGLLTLLVIWNLPALHEDRSLLVKRFGRLAAACLIWLVVTGVIMSWLHLSQPADLFSSDYGKAILSKLSLLLLVVGAASFALWKPSRQPRRWWLLETLVLGGLLGVAGLLIALPPPV